MSVQLLQKANNRLQLALLVHRELSDLFYFLALPGFHFWHEYQFVTETILQRNLKRFIIDTCGVIVYDEIAESANILEPLTKVQNRHHVKSDDRMEAIKQGFKAYQGWETESLDFYQKIAKQLSNSGALAEYAFMLDIVRDVNDELAALNQTILAYEGMSWDSAQIQSEQDTIREKYEYRLRELFKVYKVWHHHNSS